MLLFRWSTLRCPVIGMLHAPPLPGSPDYQGNLVAIRKHVLRDAETLLTGGVDALMLENFGDTPFYPERVPAETVAAMSSLATDVRSRFDVPLGINMLRNDGRSALAVAVASAASFIRVNVLCGTRVADQGLLHGIAHDLLRDRTNLQALSIAIWADVDVKHSSALADRPLTDEVADLIDRGKCDAVIVSGSATGQPIDRKILQIVKATVKSTPVVIGSGVNVDSVADLIPLADGLIVGTSLKVDGVTRRPVDLDRVKELVDAVKQAS